MALGVAWETGKRYRERARLCTFYMRRRKSDTPKVLCNYISIQVMRPRRLAQETLLPIAIGLLPSINIQPAQAACQNIQGNYGSTYFICRIGSTMTLQGSNYRTGSFWSENCYGVDRSYGGCSGIDADGNFWQCTWMPYTGSNCYKSQLMN